MKKVHKFPAVRFESDDDSLAAALEYAADLDDIEPWQCRAYWTDEERTEITVETGLEP